jgi:four helix bundle protein
MKNYKELKIWVKGIEIVKMTYQLSKQIPNEEKYGIISQMTRAAVSIPANIAEGSGRNSEKDYARFLEIALGSAFELQTYFIIAKEMGWTKSNDLNEAENNLLDEIKMIFSFISKLKQTIK